jgi:hypothetical protein
MDYPLKGGVMFKFLICTKVLRVSVTDLRGRDEILVSTKNKYFHFPIPQVRSLATMILVWTIGRYTLDLFNGTLTVYNSDETAYRQYVLTTLPAPSATRCQHEWDWCGYWYGHSKKIGPFITVHYRYQNI